MVWQLLTRSSSHSLFVSACRIVKQINRQQNYEIAKIIIQSAVSAAEQIYARSEKAGSSKKKYVLEYAKSKLAEIGLTINDKELEVYLEQAVLELKESQKDKVA